MFLATLLLNNKLYVYKNIPSLYKKYCQFFQNNIKDQDLWRQTAKTVSINLQLSSVL